jgi:CRISPR-associated protein Csh1
MIREMRELALSQLNNKLCCGDCVGMETIRQQHAKELTSYLVEDSGKIARVYVLKPTKTEHVRLYSLELDEQRAKRLPFAKPSGNNSPAIGPVIKRTTDSKKNPPFGPKPRTLNTTLKAFQAQANTPSPWQTYFQEVVDVLDNPLLLFEGETYPIPEDSNMLIKAVELIGAYENTTVFLTVATLVEEEECWPGDRPEYHDYLAHELAERKYVTKKTPVLEQSTCSFCGKQNVSIYSNAVKGAGINVGNTDRASAFAGMKKENAWKNYGLCLDCADLLYVFKNHTLPKLVSRVAGEKALLLPCLLGTELDPVQFMLQWQKYLDKTKGEALNKNVETELLEDFFKEQDDAHLVIQIIWASFGQYMEEVNGYITDVLPSRLNQLSKLNAQANNWQSMVFPNYVLDETRFELHLNMLLPLFKRPGGKRAEKVNKNKRFSELRQQLTAKIYHGEPLDDNGVHLWQEFMITARWYLADILKRGDAYGLYHEGYNEKKQRKYWTFAGWIRHLARFLHYLEQTGVLPMTTESTLTFKPEMPKLKDIFAQGAGINSDEKAFAFLVGILYGKLLQVQHGKKVNVIANTLPWLKRLQLAGKDLPELYTKICHKFLVYEHQVKETTQVIQETARVGKIVGDEIKLDITQTCYFLLLGQALAVDVLPSKDSGSEGIVTKLKGEDKE